MEDDRSNEHTETDERVAENQSPAPVASTAGGGDGASPLDRGETLDPFGGKAPSERVDRRVMPPSDGRQQT